ncbi:MAG: hypothetical protein ACM34K_07785 [Bacillota bacterium]
MKLLKLPAVLTFVLFLLTSETLMSQTGNIVKTFKIYRHSVEFSPMSPFINIYGIQYGYSFDEKNDLVLGAAYMSIPHENVGRTHASSLIIGYRRNFGKGWHAEYSLYPTYDNYFETNEKKYYNSFDLWNEFRFGYQYDFEISELPLFVKAQVPFGFAIYAENKPESFLEMEKKGDNRFFYKAVLIYVGIKL